MGWMSLLVLYPYLTRLIRAMEAPILSRQEARWQFKKTVAQDT